MDEINFNSLIYKRRYQIFKNQEQIFPPADFTGVGGAIFVLQLMPDRYCRRRGPKARATFVGCLFIFSPLFTENDGQPNAIYNFFHQVCFTESCRAAASPPILGNAAPGAKIPYTELPLPLIAAYKAPC